MPDTWLEVDPLRFGKATGPNSIAAKAHDGDAHDDDAHDGPARDGTAKSGELALVKLRYKRPDGDKSTRLDTTVLARHLRAFDKASDNLRFAAAVATFGMKLRGSKHAGAASWDDVHAWARGALGRDKQGLRGEFLRLVRLAEKS